MMTKELYTKLVNFIIPRVVAVLVGCCHIGDLVKMLYFIKNPLLYSWA